jgi:predicted  nucleic acid-binding Zn-ribbon protein
MRNQQQLGDFLFSSDLAKLRLGKTGNKARINMNRLREDQLSSSIFSLDNSSGWSTLTGTEGGGITNLNYVKNKNTAKKERRKDQVDNAKFQGNGKHSRSASKSPKSKTRKEFKQKENTRNEETKVVAMDLEEDTEEDKRKSLNLQAEIEKEQEYQNQMNMIYNNPCYFDQYSSDLQYQAELHHTLQDQFILDPHIMLQNPPMYLCV